MNKESKKELIEDLISQGVKIMRISQILTGNETGITSSGVYANKYVPALQEINDFMSDIESYELREDSYNYDISRAKNCPVTYEVSGFDGVRYDRARNKKKYIDSLKNPERTLKIIQFFYDWFATWQFWAAQELEDRIKELKYKKDVSQADKI